MARTKGTDDPQVTRKLVWMVELLRRAQEAGVKMKRRDAADLVVQAADGDTDMLRAVSKGRRRLSDDDWKAIEEAAKADVARRADRRAGEKIQRKRETASKTALRRAARDQRIATRSAVEGVLEREYGSKADKRRRLSEVRALEQAYRDRAHEIVLVDVDDLFPPEPDAPYFPA